MQRTEWDDPVDDALRLLAGRQRPTWGCLCVGMTTPDRGFLTYTCRRCVEVARARLDVTENPSDAQLTLSNWGAF